MKLPDLLRLPAGAGDARTEIEAATGGVLTLFVLTVSAMLVAAAAVQLALSPDPTATLAWPRLQLGLLAFLGAAAAWTQLRAARPRAATAIVLATAVIGVALHSALTGLGLYSPLVGGMALVIALSGTLLTPWPAVALFGLHMAMVFGMYFGHQSGHLRNAAAESVLHPQALLWAQALIGGGGALGAWALRRLLTRSLHRAMTEERRLAELLSVAHDGVWEVDTRGRLVYISEAFEVSTGVARQQLLQIDQPGGPQPVDRAQWEALRDALRRRQPFRDLPWSLRLADGHVLHQLTSGRAVQGIDGRHAGWSGVTRNVTAQVEAEQASRKEREMVDRLFQLSPDAMSVVDLGDGRVLLANPAFVAFVGRALHEVIGRNGRQLGLWKHNEDDLRLAAALNEANGLLRDWRTTAVAADGGEREVLVSAAAFERDGRHLAVIGVRDITDAERARREADAILDNASVGIVLVRNRVFERVNPQFERMVGRPVGSLAGQPTRVMFESDERHARFAQVSDEAQRTGQVVESERLIARPDGSHLLARLRARAVDPERPAEGGTIWVVEDVTEERRIEAELAEARRLAEAASEAKSAFLATMSHEIRTPLNGVLGLARLLQDERDERRRRDYLQHLMGAAEGLAGLVSDVLDLSKIEAGRVVLEDIAFDLHELVQGTFHTFAPLGRERGLAMHCRVAPDLPRQVHGDPVRVRQIVSNYLNNALKFTPRGAIELTARRAAGDTVRLEVADSGLGIAPEARERLFQPFSQADSSTTRRFGGTGLGLSICRELAVLMGGRVGVDSAQGHGSTFWVELPLAAGLSAQQTATQAAEADRALGGLTVLVAEDNPVNMLIVRTLLERLGAAVIEAEDGAQAVAMARDARPDAVLMDLHMPVMDGLAAARALRVDAATASLPLFALSAAVLEQEREQARAAGLTEFLPKPVAEADLLRVLAPLRSRAAQAG